MFVQVSSGHECGYPSEHVCVCKYVSTCTTNPPQSKTRRAAAAKSSKCPFLTLPGELPVAIHGPFQPSKLGAGVPGRELPSSVLHRNISRGNPQFLHGNAQANNYFLTGTNDLLEGRGAGFKPAKMRLDKR